MPHKYSDVKVGKKQEESRIYRIRRTIYTLLVAIGSPGNDIDSELTEAEIHEAVSYLEDACGQTGQAYHNITG